MQLSIIILSHNTKDLLAQTLASIKPKLTHEIYVIDNASSDDSASFIKHHYPKINLIKLHKNMGFAAGNNFGLKKAKGKYLLLLNSDTQIVSSALEDSVAYLRKHAQVGILTPKLSLPDGAIDLACHRGFPTPSNSFYYFLGLESLFPNHQTFSSYHQTWKDFDTTHQVDAVSGAAMFIRRQVVEDVGLLDERFFMYAEDIDYCLRAKNRGWQVVYFPKAQIVHFKGSSGTRSPDQNLKSQTRTHFYITMKQYFHKHYHGRYSWLQRFIIDKSIDIISKLKP